MRINKTTAKALRKRNLSEIARHCGRSREAVRQWMGRLSVPDDKVQELREFTGLKIGK